MKIALKGWQNPETRSLLAWLLGGLFVRSAIALWLYPGFDEAYYYLYSLHLDWSYFDHPLLVALLTGLGPWLTGSVSQFTLRLGVLLLHTGSLLLLYLTGVRLFGRPAARWTLAIATIVPIFQLAFGVLTLPDSPLIFFWTASLYCAVGEFFPASRQPYRPSYRLAILGIWVALACLGKYHGFLLGAGLLGFVLTSPRHRCALLSSWAGLSVILFFLTLFPLWFWNWQHDWVSFRFQLSSRFEPETGVPKPGYSLLKVAAVFAASIAYLFPTLGASLWWVSVRSLWTTLKRKWRSRESDFLEQQWFILCVSLPLTLGFTLLGGKEQILPAWSMPGFWGLTLLLGAKIARAKKSSWGWLRRSLRGTALLLLSLLLIALLHLNLGILQKPSRYALFGGFIPTQSDPSTELVDIQQLRRGFQTSPVLRQALAESSFVFSNAYYLGGFLGMALIPIQPIAIACFSDDMRGFASWSQPEQWLGEDGLYITLTRFHQMPELTQEFRSYFSSFVEIGTVPLRRGGEVTDVFHVYQAKTLLRPYPRSAIDTLATKRANNAESRF